MQIYNYDPDTKALIGFAQADGSPLEPGVFLIPRGCVDTPAPSIPPGHRARWDGEWLFEEVPAPEPEPQPETPPPLTPIQQIESLEREHMAPRWQRDFILGSMEREAVEIGAAQGLNAVQSVALLRSKNAGYRRLKELDEQINELRAQL